MQKLIELIDSPDPRVALLASEKVLERAWGKVKEIAQPDGPVDSPALDARRKEVRAELMKMLEAMETSVREGGRNVDTGNRDR